MGLTNVTIMIPFCRTVEELKKVYQVMKKYGLQRGKDGLQVYLMAELPSNILMAEEFAKHIDGFSIGSNDLTQLTLGLDRDSSLVAHIYDERNPAVKRSISNLIKIAKKCTLRFQTIHLGEVLKNAFRITKLLKSVIKSHIKC